MDETLAVVGRSGRPARAVYKDLVRVRLVGDLQTEAGGGFLRRFVNHAGANLHAKCSTGGRTTTKIEAIFKCFARALKYACSTDRALRGQLPSTKGCYEPVNVGQDGILRPIVNRPWLRRELKEGRCHRPDRIPSCPSSSL